MILFVGNMLKKHNYNPTYLELIAEDLKHYPIRTVSHYKNKYYRLIHMVVVFYRHIFSTKLVVIDTYSTFAFNFALIMSIISRCHRKPYILNLSGGDLENRLIKSKSFKNILDYSTLIISPSRFIFEKLQQHSFQSLYIPNYLDLDLYPYHRRTLFSPKILWVRSFHTIYNPDMAIEVLKLVKKNYSNSSLCMVGPFKDDSIIHVKALCKRYKLDSYLTLTGKISKKEIIEISKGFDFFINTTNFDNLPISVLEAMALGLPIISTNVGGLPFFLNKRNSILVNKNDSVAMADAIIRIIEAPRFGTRLSESARKTVKENHNKKMIIRKWKKIFDSYLQQG